MPNGGSDNCWACGFNRANKGKWGGFHALEEPAYCTIRSIPIQNPLWTYCSNIHTKVSLPSGPIFASGLYEIGYVRIPWHNDKEPHLKEVQGKCDVCGRSIVEGIQIDADVGEARRFCCNAHYLQWWKQNHPTEVLTWQYELRQPR